MYKLSSRTLVSVNTSCPSISFIKSFSNLSLLLVSRTSNKLKHHFLNIKQIRHVHVLAIELEHPYFGLNEWTSNLSLDLPNKSSNRLEHQLFEHLKDSNMFIFKLSNSNTVFLASNDRTSNFEFGSTHHKCFPISLCNNIIL